ncbi:hypothetical protein [Romboutsia ilealis]|jgi:hypothetical protein|uniref:hypothetical protein n=1 Tax=Romboutsia ilealis TaxID=1115758 RepID=UPI0025B73CFB|nr:hypothetical protein [Romboutsia ilealis]
MDINKLDELKEIKLKTIFYERELEDIVNIAKNKNIKPEDYISQCVIKFLLKDMNNLNA